MDIPFTALQTTTDNKKTINMLKETVLNEIKNHQHDPTNLTTWVNSISSNNIQTLVLTGSVLSQMKKQELVGAILDKCNSIISKCGEDYVDRDTMSELLRLKAWKTEVDQSRTIVLKSNIKTTDFKISLLVACMDRTEHLLRTLESWIGVSFITEIILVDYSSRIPLETNPKIMEWCKHNRVKLIRVDGETKFNLGKAYNIAVDFATNNKILKIDCDYLCLNSEWLDHLNGSAYDSHECFFIRGDWRFGHSMSGLLFCDKRDFVFYREDLNGWGFDDLDLAKRIVETKPRVKEVIWSDAKLYISHLKHDDCLRTNNYESADKAKTNYNNRLICHQPTTTINRFKYKSIVKNNYLTTVSYESHQTIPDVFCVSLAEKQERWKHFSELIPRARKFEAIDTRKNPTLCAQYGLTVRPATITYDIYFSGAPGAVGCYLSHYLIWQQIITEQIPYAIITEDDADTTTLNYFLNNCLVNLEGYDLIQLNKRFSYIKPEHRLMFHGTESYLVSLNGAKKLVEATHHPEYLEYVNHNEAPGVMEIKRTKRIKSKIRTYLSHSIIAPADKFLSMCCDPKCDEVVRLKHMNYPCVDINPLYAASDIDGGIGHLWQMSTENIGKLVDKLLQPETY